jgi:hypothetical protein
MRTAAWISFVVLLNCFPAPPASAQSATLQPGVPIERNLSAGQTHSFFASLEKNQYLQLVVDQRGIDVVVRTFSPEGRRLGEFDSPNGTEGPENVIVIAEAAGLYRIEVAPLGQYESPPPGRYEIRIVELRKATEQELQAAQNQEMLKQKAIAMLMQITESFPELHSAQTRARFQIKTGQLLWSSDEKVAKRLLEQAIDSVKEFIAGIDPDQDYFENFQAAMQLRSELCNALAASDPELALDFLRSTRTLRTPDELQENAFANQDLEMEVSLIRQVAANDPKRAFEIAEDTLKRGYAGSLADTLYRLRTKEPELAANLAHDIVTKLLNEKLLQRQDAGLLAINLLRALKPRRIQSSGSDDSAKIILLPEEDYRELLQKLMAEALSYSPPSPNFYSPERNVAQNILSFLKEMGSDVEALGPDSSAAIDKKFAELNNQNDPQRIAWQQYQDTINSGPIDSGLQAIAQAPREIRNQLYQQIASKAADGGDLTRARQIINDQITNPGERRQAQRNLEQQAIFSAAGKGRIEEALRNLSNIRPASERTRMLIQIVNQIGPGQKKAAALQSLELARSMIGESPVAQNQEQAAVLLEIARVFSKYDSNRGFELVEPLIEQFNTISEAAITMNGFGQRFYDKGEVIMTNGNTVAEMSNRLATAIGALAMADFERARQATDRIHPLGPRINTYLTIAQQAIEAAQRNSLQPRMTTIPD